MIEYDTVCPVSRLLLGLIHRPAPGQERPLRSCLCLHRQEARALVIQPDVLLMDEPLSNLDAKLRVEMRTVIKDLQSNVGITTIYVTHDQEEAMAISNRIAIMKDGEIQHIGSPRAIYQRPANLFVASFIGTTDLLEADLQTEGTSAFWYFPRASGSL